MRDSHPPETGLFEAEPYNVRYQITKSKTRIKLKIVVRWKVKHFKVTCRENLSQSTIPGRKTKDSNQHPRMWPLWQVMRDSHQPETDLLRTHITHQITSFSSLTIMALTPLMWLMLQPTTSPCSHIKGRSTVHQIEIIHVRVTCKFSISLSLSIFIRTDISFSFLFVMFKVIKKTRSAALAPKPLPSTWTREAINSYNDVCDR